MMGEENDMIPVRDNTHGPGITKMASTKNDEEAAQQRAAQQRRMVSKWKREDLEDNYLRLYEESLILKKHARKQEDKIKRMATKLLRLVSDKKKAAETPGAKKGRDIETEEMLEELHGKIRELERQNGLLKEKLMVAKQQIGTQPLRKTAYPHVQARINTGVTRSPADPRLTKSMRVSGPPPQKPTPPQQGMPRYGHSLLEEARAENKHLEDVIQQQNEQINIYEQDIEMLKEQMNLREAGYEEDLLKIKQQMSVGQRAAIQENIDIIRLQREVKEKASKLIQLQAQYSGLEEKLRSVRSSHEQVMAEMERAKTQLMEEQNRRLAVESELRMGTTSQRTLVEYQERIQDLERECDILKEANEKLVTSAFDLEREKEWRQKENALKVQIAQLEATLKADVGEKGNIIDRLTEEKDKHEELEQEHRELRISYFQLKQEHDDLKDKMQFFTKESAVDFQEIEEALMMVKQRKERDNQELDFLHRVDEEQHKDYEKMLRDLQTEHADTINELEKTRNMLITQHRINKDYQMEMNDIARKMEENKQEFDTRQQELAQLLDIRAVRIRKLEAQLRDVAYGTRQYRIRAEEPTEEEEDLEEIEETISLENGQNLFEIHIKQITLSQEAQRILGDDEPSLFATWEFYEFEIQATPVVRGTKPEFNFTSQYTVKTDDFFLHYLQKDSCTLELHQSFGTDYRTVAACQLKMRDILDKSQGRLHGSMMLTGVQGEGQGINFGLLEYWVRLKVPMEQALRLYKERTKSLGYIQSNARATAQALEAMDENAAMRPPDNVNQLRVNLIRCSGLLPRRDVVQPSPYCIYKFFDFPDHDTAIVESSNNPEYNDHKSFPVPMTADLDKYLKSQPLQIFVFDDTDPEEASYIGFAKIALIPLAHDKSIQGIFELHNAQGEPTGSIEISLKWQFSYLPPKASTKTLAQLRAEPEDKPENIHLLPGEEDQMRVASEASRVGPQPLSRPPRPRGAPTTAALAPRRPQEAVKTEALYQEPLYEEPMPDIPEDRSSNASVVTEGSPVPGESESVSSVSSAASSSRRVPVIESQPPPPSLETAAMIGTANLSHTLRRKPPTVQARQRQSEGSDHSQKEDQEENGRITEEDEEMDEEEEKTPQQLIAEELGEQLNDEEDLGDTMFEEQQKQASDDYSDAGEDEEAGERHSSFHGSQTDTDDDIVVASPTSRPQSILAHASPADLVVVTIAELSIHEESPISLNEHFKMLYVEYTFLGVPREETETPFSLPKPAPNDNISFNFTKTFHIDFERNYSRRQFLASMLLPNSPEQGRIRFNVVAEPEDPEEDCEDVGAAYADLNEILDSERDIVDQNVPIWDVHDEQLEVGTMKITVQCLEALKAIQQEMGTDASLSMEA